MPVPGATMSGLASKSMAEGPRELNGAIDVVRRRPCLRVLDAPTVSTQGALPGAVMPPYCGWPSAFLPRLPAAATTTMPASTAPLGRERQRVGVVGLGDRRAHREVDDADVVGRAVRDRPVERGDHVADDAAAVAVEHLQANQVRVRARSRRASRACRSRCRR